MGHFEKRSRNRPHSYLLPLDRWQIYKGTVTLPFAIRFPAPTFAPTRHISAALYCIEIRLIPECVLAFTPGTAIDPFYSDSHSS